MRRTRVLLTGALAVAAALPLAASAAPAVPAPTASAWFETTDPPVVPAQKQPEMTATWATPKPGHDGTLTVSGTPVPVLSGHADALWTSAPLVVKRRGVVGKIAVTWSGLQLDPYDQGIANQVITVRFTDAKGKWGPWVTALSEPLTSPLDTGTQHSKVLPISYNGPVPAKTLRVQVAVADTFSIAVTRLSHVVRITL